MRALLAGLGRYEAVAEPLSRCCSRGAPDDARLHANVGHVLHCVGDFRTAIEHCRRAIELEPGLPEAHLHLGNSLLALNALYEADAAYRAGLEIAPDHAALHTAHAMAERALGRLADAEASTRRALALRPGAADTLALLGSLAIDHGRFDEAEDLLRKALVIDPELPEALTSLSAVRKMSTADADWRDAAERVLARGLPVSHAINLHHALGKYCDDVDDREGGFRASPDGQRARPSQPAALRPCRDDAAGDTDLADFDAKTLAALRPGGNASELPVFVVGMPRSGTSLTEQVLASHPQGARSRRAFVLDICVGRRARRKPGAAGRDHSRARPRLSGGARGAGTRALRASSTSCRSTSGISASFTQRCRAPGSFISSAMLLDTCLSIYFQGFSAAHPYATDFGDLAHYYHEYRRLMMHWHAVLPPGTLIDVRYEDLVDDPEGGSRRMLEHLGLPWDPRCLEFHRTQRPVLTASNWQVRQPMNRNSVDRWRRYQRFIGPLREALGDEPGADGAT